MFALLEKNHILTSLLVRYFYTGMILLWLIVYLLVRCSPINSTCTKIKITGSTCECQGLETQERSPTMSSTTTAQSSAASTTFTSATTAATPTSTPAETTFASTSAETTFASTSAETTFTSTTNKPPDSKEESNCDDYMKQVGLLAMENSKLKQAIKDLRLRLLSQVPRQKQKPTYRFFSQRKKPRYRY